MKDARRMQEQPEIEPEPMPTITPDMIQTTFKALETRGMVYYSGEGAYIPTEKGWKLLMKVSYEREEIIGRGHPKITATNINEIVITKDSEPRENSDAVICVDANKSCAELNNKFKDAIKENKSIEMILEADGINDTIIMHSSPALKLTSRKNIETTKLDVIKDDTVGIMADKASCDLKEELIEKLKNHETEVKITLQLI